MADSVYWMSRYIERAETLARCLDVHLATGKDESWARLLSALGEEAAFAERCAKPVQEKVIEFLVFDSQNPNSILCCLRAARKNAEQARGVISAAMWVQLMSLCSMVESAAAKRSAFNPAEGFFADVELASLAFIGVTDSTITHSTVWHFIQIGRMLERADKTSRILDMNSLNSCINAQAGTSHEQAQLDAILRWALALETFSNRYSRFGFRDVVDFLVLADDFPRSIQFCVRTARDSLNCVAGPRPGEGLSTPQRLLGRICSHLTYVSVDDIFQRGLHDYIDDFQTELNLAGQAIFEQFFASNSLPIPTK